MRWMLSFCFWAIVLVMWPSVSLYAIETVLLEDETGYVVSGRYLEILEHDSDSVEEITHQSNDELFYALEDSIPNLGYKSHLWIRFQVENRTDKKWMLVLSRKGFDRVDFYIPKGDGSQSQMWDVQTSGYVFPFSQRKIKSRDIAFYLQVAPGKTHMCYMRLFYATQGRMKIPLTIWSEQAFFTAERKEAFVLGLYYGLMAIMVLYNLFLFFSLRDIAYLYYVLFAFCLAIFTAIENGIAPQYIWPNGVWGYKYTWFIFMGFSYIFGLKFLQIFLRLPSNGLQIQRILSCLIALNFLFVFAPIFQVHTYLFVWTSTYNLVFHVIIALLVFYCWRNNVIQARFILIAWLLPLMGGVLNNLSAMGVLPPLWIFRHSPQIGYACETVLFSFALADRINLMRREKEDQIIARSEAERRAETAELQAHILRQEEQRKAEEMEQARQLQLSMLPHQAPKLPHLDIAFSMSTATEVGGDYCDFHLNTPENVLTVALGDATGHGLRAGIVVAATKSLFLAYAHQPNILETFAKMSQHLIEMNLKYSNMAMTLLKITDTHLQFSTAGIPPMLIYRAETGEVEEILLEGMPLGSSKLFEYELVDQTLYPNDVILLMSDGLPEMLNVDEKPFGYERMAHTFKAFATLSAKAICDSVREQGERWAEKRGLDDDVTLVVIKVKSDG